MKLNKFDFEVVDLFQFPTLFTAERIDRELVPDGWYAYDIRHGDDWGTPCTVEKIVKVNHFGTILLPFALDFKDKDYIKIDADDDFGYLSVNISFEEYNKALSKEYEKFKFAWLSNHGYTIYDIINALEELHKDAPETDIPMLFSTIENDIGLNGALYPCYQEWLNNECSSDLFM